MIKKLKLLFSVFLVIIALDCDVNAKEVKCAYELKNLNIEAVLYSGATRTYTVNVSCKIVCQHRNQESVNEPVPYDTAIKPIVVSQEGDAGKNESCEEGRKHAYLKGRLRLFEECVLFKCNCEEAGCSCPGCIKK